MLRPEAREIRAHLSDRDTAFSDDFVGVVLDTFNDKRRAFEFFVNPMGVQMDLIQDDTNGTEDESWDAIWRSGRTDHRRRIHRGDGYPLHVDPASRRPTRSRRGVWIWCACTLAAMSPHRTAGEDRNRSCYLCQSSRVTGFRGITPGRDIELDPTVTAQQTSTRAFFPNGRLSSGGTDLDVGLTARGGITPNLR